MFRPLLKTQGVYLSGPEVYCDENTESQNFLQKMQSQRRIYRVVQIQCRILTFKNQLFSAELTNFIAESVEILAQNLNISGAENFRVWSLYRIKMFPVLLQPGLRLGCKNLNLKHLDMYM